VQVLPDQRSVGGLLARAHWLIEQLAG